MRTLTGLHPAVGWEEPGTLRVAARHRAHRRLDGQGPLLLPSAFVRPALTVVTDPPWQPTLIYPARGVGELWHGGGPAAPRALARLLGRTRALLLAALDEPATTTRPARAHGLAPATVSAHLTALRESGLVSRHRIGRTVAYARTPLGLARLHGGGTPGTPAPPPR
ncbi:ArsR family transcriptional regulator [Streptomyces albidoflavus]